MFIAMIAINSTIDIKAMYFQFYYSYVQTNILMSDQPLKWSNIRSEDYSILIGSTALSPLTCISQKTGMRFVKSMTSITIALVSEVLVQIICSLLAICTYLNTMLYKQGSYIEKKQGRTVDQSVVCMCSVKRSTDH